MKRLLLTLLFLTVLPLSVTFAQAPPQGDASLLVYGSAWTDDDFVTTHGGLKLGMQQRIGEGTWMRWTYSQYNFDPEPIQSFGASFLFDWYAGKQLTIYLMTGAEGYVAGENSGIDLATGLSIARPVWEIQRMGWLVNPTVNVFADITFTDAGGQSTGSYAQFNLGIMFNRGAK